MSAILKTIFSCHLIVLVCFTYNSFQASLTRRKVMCNEIPEPVLSEILGPAYNSRYMSINPPREIEINSNFGSNLDMTSHKRAPLNVPPFYVDDHFAQELSEKPAWSVNHILQNIDVMENKKIKRAVNSVRQWECESKIRWMDLGTDYFPRYLRSVECTSQTCWYNMLNCKPRSFTVKILRRKRDKCDNGEAKVGVSGLPKELRELWIWEERAVNFCCDCAL